MKQAHTPFHVIENQLVKSNPTAKFAAFLFAILLLLLPAGNAWGQTTVKMGADGADYTLPFNNFYRYSWNQMIYTAEELGGAKTISQISFLIGAVPSSNWSADDFRVYMGHTSLCGSTGSTDVGITDWVSSSNLTQVYSSSSYTPTTYTTYTDFAQNWWVTITLSTSFSYNGTDNLAIVIAKHCANYESGLKFKYITDAHYQCIYRQNDNTSSYAQHPGSNSGTQVKNRPILKLTASSTVGDVINIKKTTVTTSGVNFYDEGGSGGDCSNKDVSNNYYTRSAIFRHIFTAPEGYTLKTTFSEFCSESKSYDWMYVYDGYNEYSNALSEKLGDTPSTLPGPYSSTGQSMTFTFRTDGSVNRAGWSASIVPVEVARPTKIVASSNHADDEMTWAEFAGYVNGGYNYAGKTVYLMEDVTVTTMVGIFTNGSADKTFNGTFEGNHHTLTVNISSMAPDYTGDYNEYKGAAPFRYISGATIKDLKVTGTVTANQYHAAGLVGFASGTNTIENCHVSTNVTNNNNHTSNPHNINNYIGGFIGHNLNATTYITGCVYDGTLTSRGFKGGMFGFANANSTINITNTYYGGGYSSIDLSTPNFSPVGVHGQGTTVNINFNNFYYNHDIQTFTVSSYEGTVGANITGTHKHGYTISGSGGVTVARNGNASATYSDSKITAYSPGIVYNGTLIAGSDEAVGLTLSNSSTGVYYTNHGTFSGTGAYSAGGSTTLTMEAANATISAACPPVTITGTTGTTYNTIKVSISSLGSSWQYKLVKGGTTVRDWTTLPVSSGTGTISNVDAATTYTVYVRTACTGGSYGTEASTSVTTPCQTPTLTWSSGPTEVELFHSFTRTATSTSGAIPTYSATGAATVNSTPGEVTGTAEGNASITATVASSGSYCSASGSYAVTVTKPAPTAPITASATPANYGGTCSLTASGGYAGTNTEYYWYKGSCPSVGFIEQFQTQGTYDYHGYSNTSVTVNSCVNGILNVTSSDGIDPCIDMYGICSCDPNIYKYVQIRYRWVSGSEAGDVQIFFTNSNSTEASGTQMVSANLISDGNWHVAVVPMYTHSLWTHSNITGWRYDFVTSSCTMEIDYIALVSEPCVGMGASTTSTVAVTEPSDFQVMVIGENGYSDCKSAGVSLLSPTVTQSSTPVCGNNVTFEASNGGVPLPDGAAYHWYTDTACTHEITDGVSGPNNSQLSYPASAGTTLYCRVEGTYQNGYDYTYNSETTYPQRNFEYTGSVQEYNVPDGATELKLEVWGAQSIYSTTSPSSTYVYGNGGYASGTMNNLTGVSTLYVYVGGRPGSDVNGSSSYYYGGWNGGGGKVSASSYNDNGPGGGATDICLTQSAVTLSNYRYTRTDASYKSRLIVAGGGGGGRSTSYDYAYGGYVPGATLPTGTDYYYATMNGAGKCDADATVGGFGYGANSTNTSDDRGCGGGGWYGGGSYGDNCGGGGSSFVWCDTYASYVPTDYTPTASMKMTDVTVKAGSQEMPAPGGGTETGHSGNGYARITATVVTVTPVPHPHYDPWASPAASVAAVCKYPAPTVEQTTTPACGESTTFTASVSGGTPSGAIYRWYTDAECTHEITSGTTGFVSFSGADHATLQYVPTIGQRLYCRIETGSDLTTEFGYSGGVQTYTVPEGTTSLDLEVWGAQGGGSIANGTPYSTGGKGGHSQGTCTVTSGTTLYVAVGGKGSDGVLGASGVSCVHTAPGGWNGGGSGTCDASGEAQSKREASGAGGGATHIATANGKLRDLGSNQSAVLIVAGGGGGGSYQATGGAGGGTNPGSEQTAGNGTLIPSTIFGQGADGDGNGDGDGVAGGGGGWEGGRTRCTAANSDKASFAGGGKGYIDGVTNGTTENGIQSGNGRALITAHVRTLSDAGSVEMLCNHDPATLPYTHGFDDATENNQWTIFNGDDGWSVGTAAASTSGNALYVSDNGGTNYSYSHPNQSIYAYRNFVVTEEAYYSVAYNWKANGQYNCDYLRVFIVPTSLDPALRAGNTNGIGTTGAPNGWIAADGGVQLSVQTGWQEVTTENRLLLTPQEYYLVFYWHSDASTYTNPPAAVDDILIKKTCDPRELTWNNTSNLVGQGSTASFTVTPTHGDGTITYGTANASIADMNTSTGVVTGVSAGEVEITASIPEGIIYCAATATQRILVAAPATRLPYTHSFDNTEENGHWTLSNGGQTNQWMIGNDTYSTASNSLYITNNSASNAYTVNLPEPQDATTYAFAFRPVHVEAAGNYTVAFKWQANGENNNDYLLAFLVPASVNPDFTSANTAVTYSNTPSGWVKVNDGQLSQKTSWQDFFGTVSLASAGDYYLVFYWKNNQSAGNQPPAAVDDIEICPVITPPVATQDPFVDCYQATVEVATGNYYGLPYIINWYDDTEGSAVSTGATRTVSATGTYYAAYSLEGTHCASARAEVHATVHQFTKGSISGAAQVCHGAGTTVSVTGTAATGNPDITYRWFVDGTLIDGQNDVNCTVPASIVSNLNVGDHTITREDKDPCGNNGTGSWNQATGSFILYVRDVPAAPALTATSPCDGHEATLSVTSGGSYTFRWYDSNNSSIGTGTSVTTGALYTSGNNTAANTFHATATADYAGTSDYTALSCTSNPQNIVVTVQAYPTVAISPKAQTVDCSGNVVDFSTTGNGASFLWSGSSSTTGSASIAITVTAGNSQNVTVTAYNSTGDCSVTDVATITVHPFSAGSITSVTNSVCSDYSSSIRIDNSNEGTSSGTAEYQWRRTAVTSGAPAADNNNLGSNSYYDITPTEIAQLIGSSVQPQTYQYTRYRKNNCTGSYELSDGTYTLTVKPVITITGVTGNNSVSCGDAAVLTAQSLFANADVTYTWTNGTEVGTGNPYTTQQVLHDDATYTLAATAADNSRHCDARQTYPVQVTITRDAPPHVTVNHQCTGLTSTLSVQSPQAGRIYQWSDTPDFSHILHIGDTYETDVLGTETTRYYVRSLRVESHIESRIEDSIYYVSEEQTAVPFNYTGNVQEYNVPAGAVSLKLEVWGAQSIYSTTSPSSTYVYGNGGYASGTMNNLTGVSTLYVYVGGRPGSDVNGSSSYYYGGWNGGGGKVSASSYNDNGPGGGATDICLTQSAVTLSNYRYTRTDASYKSRLIVAGGGGGGRSTSYDYAYGGYVPGATLPTGTDYYYATMNGAGKCDADATVGGFGYGANSTNTSDDRGCGGGGWYGGGSYGDNCGGGGSSFVWCDTYASYVPTDYTPTASMKMTDVTVKAGSQEMPAPGGSTETGHSGNGYARITPTVNVQHTMPVTHYYTVYDTVCYSQANEITITPVAVPTVTASMNANDLCPGESTTLTATPSGTSSTVTYQWYGNGTAISGATGATYVAYPSDTTTYRVELIETGTQSCQRHVWAPEELTVNVYVFNKGIVGGSAAICHGESINLPVTTATPATGKGNILYQWYLDDTPISGANAQGYTLPASTVATLATGNAPTNHYLTRTALNNCTGSYVQSEGTFTIKVKPVMEITGVTGETTVICGNTTTLTAHTPGSGYSGNLRYRWYSDSEGQNFVYESNSPDFSPKVMEDITYYVQVVEVTESGSSSSSTSEVVTDFDYTGNVQEYVVPDGATSLKLEVWGAQGGASRGNQKWLKSGGLGGYYAGRLDNPTPGSTLYVAVGGKGTDAVLGSGSIAITAAGGWNGGGGGTCDDDASSDTGREASGAGGGATHIATATGQLQNLSSNQNAVLIVAGGGGGSSWENRGGEGGGTSPGIGANGGTVLSGSLGKGANASGMGSNDGVGGGGGGWPGGNAYNCNNCAGSNGAGGSGYLRSDLTSLGFQNGGNAGNGKARITATITTTTTTPITTVNTDDLCVSSLFSVSLTVTRDPAPVVDTVATCPEEPTTLSVHEQLPGRVYQWSTDPTFPADNTFEGPTYHPTTGSTPITYYVRSLRQEERETTGYNEVPYTEVSNFDFTGAEQTYAIPEGATSLKFEVWGAQGGDADSQGVGGKGGYSVGTLTNLMGINSIYVYIGGQPAYKARPASEGDIDGGFNGGGKGLYSEFSGTSTYSEGGGGGTDIRLNGNTLYHRVIVAGGGSGSAASVTSNSWTFTNGYAGGGTTSEAYSDDYRATQTNYGNSGDFGQGGNPYYTTAWKYIGAGGGGGWYGGGSTSSCSDTDPSVRQQNGGGSGYVYTSSTASSYPSGCQLNSNYYLTSASTIIGTSSFISPYDGTSKTGHTGDGYARITATGVKHVPYTTTDTVLVCESHVTAVTVHPEYKPVVAITPVENDEGCKGQTASFIVSSNSTGSSYQWSTGSYSTEASMTVSGSVGSSQYVYVTAYNATGHCSTTASYTLTVRDVPGLANISAPAEVFAGTALPVSAPTITNNGSTVTAQGWQTSPDGSSNWTNLSSSTIAAIPIEYDGLYLRYYATNHCGTSYSNVVQIKVKGSYEAKFISASIGESTWCIGETRNVTLTIKNTGTATWYANGDASQTRTNRDLVAVSYHWDEDYDKNGYISYDLHNNRNLFTHDVAPGETAEITFEVKGPRMAGSNHLKFAMIRRECCWFYNQNECSSSDPGEYVFDITVPEMAVTATPETVGGCGSTTLSSNCNLNSSFYKYEPYIWDWNSEQYNTGNAIGTPTVKGSILWFTTTGVDPAIDMLNIGHFDPQIYKTFKMRYRITSGQANGGMQIYHTWPEHPGVDSETQAHYGTLVSDGQWHILEMDMVASANTPSNWTNCGEVTGWRFDPCQSWDEENQTYIPVTMQIDWIGLFPDPIAANTTSVEVAPVATTNYYAVNYETNRSYIHKGTVTVPFGPHPSNIPYACDFETECDYANWQFGNGTQTNQWMIGNATSHSGNTAIYITNDQSSNAYTIKLSDSQDATSYVYAYRELIVDEAGDYQISFDWKANGESSWDLLRAFLVPVSANPNLAGGTANGQTGSTNSTPTGWIDVSQVGGKMNLQSEWQHSVKNVTLTTTGNYYLVFFWKNDNSTGSQPPAAVDDIQMVYKRTMVCGTSYSGTLAPNGGIWKSYTGCSGTNETGMEHIYRFLPHRTGSYTFHASVTGSPAFHLMEAPDDIVSNTASSVLTTCWSSGDKTVTLTGGRTYYLIIDNRSSSADAGYTVSVECPEECDLVTVGDATTNNENLPSHSNYNYSLTQQIYTPCEIGTAGEINSISFYNSGSTKDRLFDVYLVATDKTSFNSNTDWIPVTADNLVYHATIHNTITAGNWTTLYFNTPFQYNGSSNLAVIIDDNNGSYSSGMKCSSYVAENCQSIYIYSDATNYNPEAPGSYSGTRLAQKNVVKFGICDQHATVATYTITATATTGGSVSGDGTFGQCETVTLTATSDDGFDFAGWEENGVLVYNEATYTFPATTNRTLIARFVNNCPMVEVTGGTVSNNQYLPSYSANNYSLSEQIYAPCEIGTAGTITSISFYNSISWSTSQFDIYLVATDKAAFNGSNDWIQLTADNLVCHVGSETPFTANSWNTFYFDTPFQYDGVSHLAVIVKNNSGVTYNSTNINAFNVFATDEPQALYISGTTNYNPVTLSSDGTVLAVKNRVQFGICGQSQPNVTYTVAVTAGEGGHATGGGTFAPCETVTLTATNTFGYTFAGWEEDGAIVSTDATYTFRASGNRNIIARFASNCPIVEVGEGATGTNQYIPSNGGNAYSLSEQIYTPCEIGAAGEISSIAFYNSGDTSVRKLDIWLVYTDKTSFSGSYDWIHPTDGDLVYHAGTAQTLEPGWNTFRFSTPFEYDGLHNLAVIVSNSRGASSVSNKFRTYSTSTYQTLYINGSSYNSAAISSYGTPSYSKNAVQFGMCGQTAPVRITATAEGGGRVQGAGTYSPCQTVTMTATPDPCYNFVAWKEGDDIVSTEAAYTFSAERSRDLTAVFAGWELSLTAQPDATECFTAGSELTLTASTAVIGDWPAYWPATLDKYTFSTGTDGSKWRTLTNNATTLTSANAEGDNVATEVNDIGFIFTFGTGNYTQFSANSDGNLRLGSTVTTTYNYTSPFSSSNASVNAPKINFFGCDGFLPSAQNGGYIKKEVFGSAPNRVCVVEFSTNTYSQYSSNYNFKWQVQLYEGTGQVLIVYPSTVPTTPPSVACQHGLCTGGDDIILVDANHTATHYTSGQSSTIAANSWPGANRWYSFTPPTPQQPSPVNYVWRADGTAGTVTEADGSSVYIANPSEATNTYTVTATYNGCSQTQSYTVNTFGTPTNVQFTQTANGADITWDGGGEEYNIQISYFADGFESYDAFSVDPAGRWTYYDGDGGEVYGYQNVELPNAYYI